MDIKEELTAIRYLVNDLILYVYDMRVKLDRLSPRDLPPIMAEPNINGNTISFDLFDLNLKQYNNLIRKHGIDIVNRACARMDEFIKVNEYIPFGKPYVSLRKQFIPEIILDDSKRLRNVDLNNISLAQVERNDEDLLIDTYRSDVQQDGGYKVEGEEINDN